LVTTFPHEISGDFLFPLSFLVSPCKSLIETWYLYSVSREVGTAIHCVVSHFSWVHERTPMIIVLIFNVFNASLFFVPFLHFQDRVFKLLIYSYCRFMDSFYTCNNNLTFSGSNASFESSLPALERNRLLNSHSRTSRRFLLLGHASGIYFLLAIFRSRRMYFCPAYYFSVATRHRPFDCPFIRDFQARLSVFVFINALLLIGVFARHSAAFQFHERPNSHHNVVWAFLWFDWGAYSYFNRAMGYYIIILIKSGTGEARLRSRGFTSNSWGTFFEGVDVVGRIISGISRSSVNWGKLVLPLCSPGESGEADRGRSLGWPLASCPFQNLDLLSRIPFRLQSVVTHTTLFRADNCHS
jgi:hypothetical protein